MDDEVNDMHTTQAPIVVDETETVCFEHKVEPATKPDTTEDDTQADAVAEGGF